MNALSLAVIASAAKQSSREAESGGVTGLLRRSAPRNDGRSGRATMKETFTMLIVMKAAA
jgi:hypothetical protein